MLCPCAITQPSFKGCALPPSLLFHAPFLVPIRAHNIPSTIFWRDNQKIAGFRREILYNILPSTGHAGDLGDAQFQSRGPRRSTCLDLPRDLVLKTLPHLDLPRDPILGSPSCLELPGDSISRRLSHLSLPGDLHPDPGTLGSRVATLLGRISFRKTHP